MKSFGTSAQSALIVKVAVLATILVVSLAFLMLSFLGRYLEQRAVLASLTPALVSSDFAVVSSALDVLRETVSPSRFNQYRQIARRRLQEMMNTKWNDATLSQQALVSLQLTLDNAATLSTIWIRSFEGYEKSRERLAKARLKKLIVAESAMPDNEELVGLLTRGETALNNEDCQTALSAFERATRRNKTSYATRVGRHLSNVCLLGVTASRPPKAG